MFAPICRDFRKPSSFRALSRVLLKLGVPALAVAVAGVALGQPAKPAEVPANGHAAEPAFRNGRENGGRENGGDFPAADMHVAVEANARLTHLRVTYHSLQDSLNQACRLMQRNFEQSPELTEALKTEQSAWEDYLAARGDRKSVV